jgi:hypothetical protein
VPAGEAKPGDAKAVEKGKEGAKDARRESGREDKKK